jgi:hypothetical protein
MVHNIADRTKDKAEAPGRVCKTRPGNLRRYHHLSTLSSGTRALGGRFGLADERPEGTFTLPADAGYEGAMLAERVYLPVLVLPLTGGRHALAGFPRSARPQRPIVASVDFPHLLS